MKRLTPEQKILKSINADTEIEFKTANLFMYNNRERRKKGQGKQFLIDKRLELESWLEIERQKFNVLKNFKRTDKGGKNSTVQTWSKRKPDEFNNSESNLIKNLENKVKWIHEILLMGEKPSISAYAITHFYLGDAITPNNKNRLSRLYGWNANKLYNQYRIWEKEEHRMKDSDNARFNHARKKNFLAAIKLLETYNTKISKTAQLDFDKIS
jgi:hypothetical protein